MPRWYIPADILVDRCNICRGVLAKLLIFALSLGVVPISSYFLSRDYLWDGTSVPPPPRTLHSSFLSTAGNTIYAAITAIVAANVVLVAYIIESLREEARLKTKEKGKQPAQSKKDR